MLSIIIEGYPSVHQEAGMPGWTVFYVHMHKYHHPAVHRCILSVHRWAAEAVQLNPSDLTGFQVSAIQVAVLLTLAVLVDLARRSLPKLQNAQYYIKQRCKLHCKLNKKIQQS